MIVDVLTGNRVEDRVEEILELKRAKEQAVVRYDELRRNYDLLVQHGEPHHPPSNESRRRKKSEHESSSSLASLSATFSGPSELRERTSDGETLDCDPDTPNTSRSIPTAEPLLHGVFTISSLAHDPNPESGLTIATLPRTGERTVAPALNIKRANNLVTSKEEKDVISGRDTWDKGSVSSDEDIYLTASGTLTENETVGNAPERREVITITDADLDGCVHHIESLLRNIEALQKSLRKDSRSSLLPDENRSLVHSYRRTRNGLDNLLMKEPRAPEPRYHRTNFARAFVRRRSKNRNRSASPKRVDLRLRRSKSSEYFSAPDYQPEIIFDRTNGLSVSCPP